ncbi:MAG: hypothetical protein AB8B64_18745 [Granulosicoccus sp.]
MKYPCLTLALANAVLAGCVDTQSIDTTDNNHNALPQPRSVSTLRNTTDIPVHLRASVNGSVLTDTAIRTSVISSLPIPSAALNETINELDVLFYVPADQGNTQELPLARAQYTLPDTQIGTVTLPGRLYQYEDSDNDGIANVHELLVSPNDLDNDDLVNVLDEDSDGDSINDGDDTLPFEGADNPAQTSGPARIIQMNVNGTRVAVPVERIVGDTEELLHSVDTVDELPLRGPDLWPHSPIANELANKQWTAYGVKAGTQELCPEWTQSVGTSSVRSSVQGSILLYFRRDDGTAFVSALDNNDLVDLDTYDNTPTNIGRGPYNDGLRMLLVPRGTVGWVELFVDRDFRGSVCTLNLTSERPG